MIRQILDKKHKEEIVKLILNQLPDWFGMPESIIEYANLSRELPLWADIVDNDARGFIVLRETSEYAVEVYVMGVLQEYHRHGIGLDLFETMYCYAKENGYEFIHVKTVKAGVYEDYDRTNAFYKSVGFKELECLPELWDEANPCQIYVMSVK